MYFSNISCRNIKVYDNRQLKLTNLHYVGKKLEGLTICATLYDAPERNWRRMKPSIFVADMWSMGMVLYHMLTGDFPINPYYYAGIHVSISFTKYHKMKRLHCNRITRMYIYIYIYTYNIKIDHRFSIIYLNITEYTHYNCRYII